MKQAIRSIVVLVFLLLLFPTGASSQTFTDTHTHWAKDAIRQLASLDIVDGYQDGSFRPEGNITREQFIKMLVSISDFMVDGHEAASYVDVNTNRWSYPYIETGVKQGIINPYLDGKKFKPDQNLTREEIALWVGNFLKFKPNPQSLMLYNDADRFTLNGGVIGGTIDAKILTGYSDGTFRPTNHATRAEASAILMRVIEEFSKIKEIKHVHFIPFIELGKIGYKNEQGIVAISPQFAEAEYFSEGLAKVRKTGEKYGYINEKGYYIISAQYDDAGYFKNGVAPVLIDGKYGYIDTKGNIVIAAQYDWASDFVDRVARVIVDGRWGLIDRSGHYVIEPQFEQINEFHFGLAAVKRPSSDWGYINMDGEIVITEQYRGAGYFNDGFARVYDRSGDKLIDIAGHSILNIDVDLISDPTEGLAAVRINHKWGFVNSSGKIIIDPQFEDVKPFENGFSLVKDNGKWGAIRQNGEWYIPAQYDAISFTGDFPGRDIFISALLNDGDKNHYFTYNFYGDKFAESVVTSGFFAGRRIPAAEDIGSGLYFARMDVDGTNKTYILNSDGKRTIEITFTRGPNGDLGTYGGTSGVYLVAIEKEQGMKYGYADESGELIIPFIYDLASPFGDHGFGIASKDGVTGFVHKDGTFYPFDDQRFDNSFVLTEGYACARIWIMPGPGWQYGCLDSKGNTVIEPKYNTISDVKDGWACIDDSRGRGYKLKHMKTKREIVLGDWNCSIFDFSGGISPVIGYEPRLEDGHELHYRVLKIIDWSRKDITAPIFEIIYEFKDGLAGAQHKGKWGMIDKWGNWVVSPEYDRIGDVSEGMIPVEKDGKWGFVNTQNELIIPLQYRQVDSFQDGIATLYQENGGRMLYANKSGDLFSMIDTPRRGLTRVQSINDKYGFIDLEGSLVIAPIYELATGFSHGSIEVKDESGWHTINRLGEKTKQ